MVNGKHSLAQRPLQSLLRGSQAINFQIIDLANLQLKSRVVMEEKGSGVVEDYRFWHERRTTKLERAREVEEEPEQVRETLIAIINAQEAKAK
jgi:hypothetical protein